MKFEFYIIHWEKFYVHISVYHKSTYLEDQRDAVPSSLYLFYC